MSSEAFVKSYIDALNDAVQSRAFAPMVKRWFAEECTFHIYNEEHGLEATKRFWTHLLPVGENAPREVLQFPYKVQDGRVFCWRQLQGGNAPRPLYGLQETQFDDRTFISEIIIRSVQEKPEVDTDPRAATCRLGRIFLAFADAFNEFFISGDSDILTEWLSQDVRMVADSRFYNMGVIGPHNRINQNARFALEELEEGDDGVVVARVGFVNWGGLDKGVTPWRMRITPDEKIAELNVGLEI